MSSLRVIAEFKVEPKDPTSLLDIGEAAIEANRIAQWAKGAESHVRTVILGAEKILPRPNYHDPNARYLTERQAEILLCISKGMSDKKIAEELDITYGTVKTHCKSIYRCIGVSNRTAAARWLLDNLSEISQPKSTTESSSPSDL